MLSTCVRLLVLSTSLWFKTESVQGELIRNQAKLMSTIATAGVEIVTIVIGNSYGVESYMMVRIVTIVIGHSYGNESYAIIRFITNVIGLSYVIVSVT